MLDKFRFVYRLAEGDDRKVIFLLTHLPFSFINAQQKFKGVFRGSFIIQTFAAHFHAIAGSKRISALEDVGLASSPDPRGALALSTAAVCLMLL